jgi:hypothetical protein
MKSMKRPTFTILALVLFCLPAAHAASPDPSAQGSAAPVLSASPAAPPTGMSVSSYAWPKETSEQPKEEEWAGATELESITTVASSAWVKKPVKCRQRVLREWVRIDCSPPDPPTKEFFEGQRFYGSLWGLAGDISGASGQFQLVSSIEAYAKKTDPDPTNVGARLTRAMGAVGTAIFQAKYGNATMLRLDQAFWAENYDGGGNVLISPGIIIDVSWALGEKHPTINLLG